MSTDFVLMNYCWIWAGLPIEDQFIKITVVTLLLILNSCPAETETLEKSVNDVALMFLLLTLNIFHTFFRVSIVDFQQVNVNCQQVNVNWLVAHKIQFIGEFFT